MAHIIFPLIIPEGSSLSIPKDLANIWQTVFDTPRTTVLKETEGLANKQAEEASKRCSSSECPLYARCNPSVHVGFRKHNVTVETSTDLTQKEFAEGNPLCGREYGASWCR